MLKQRKINEPQLNDEAQSALHHLFNDRIVSLHLSNRDGLFIKTQRRIVDIQRKIEFFIKFNPLSKFEIIVLDKTMNVEDPLMSLMVKNYTPEEEKLSGVNPETYVIAIHPNWQDADIYKESIDGVSLSRWDVDWQIIFRR